MDSNSLDAICRRRRIRRGARRRPDASRSALISRSSCCRPSSDRPRRCASRRFRNTTPRARPGTGTTSTFGEHTGTHFDAPIHWFTGKDLPNNAVDTLPVRDMIAPACVIDCAAEAAKDADFLLTILIVEALGEAPRRDSERALGAAAHRLVEEGAGATTPI